MKNISLSDYGELRDSELGQVICPIISRTSLEGGVDYIPCTNTCAWCNIKSVTDKGQRGVFCGDKFIGNYIERKVQ